ncbi:SDR family oxidoreductase [Tumidithrix helvetica PCC 7403]|uniref:SDR family oxidoreductase n=1 Tax=Tumidithrix helvetica TaxID=3457545 RepID=UPI003CA4D908
MASDLAGKKVIITGASSGIGKQVTLQLLQAGAEVALVSRNPANVAIELVGVVAETKAKAKTYAIDLANVDQVASQIGNVIANLGGVDILINNAGMAYVGEIIDMPLATWQSLMDLNLTSVFQCIQAVLPTMRSQGHGTIVNVASIAGKQAFPSWGAYSASKFAILGLTQALAAEERSHGIKVMSICPGSVDTPLWDSLGAEVAANFDRKMMLQPETVAEAILSLLTLPPSAVITDLVLMPNAGVL